MRIIKESRGVALIGILVVSTLTASAYGQDGEQELPSKGESISIDAVRSKLLEGSDRYRRILDRPSMSAGVYVLATASTDNQRPHDRDEIYYVMAGAGKLAVESDTLVATPGIALFVPAGAVHRFVEITETLELLVFFGGEN